MKKLQLRQIIKEELKLTDIFSSFTNPSLEEIAENKELLERLKFDINDVYEITDKTTNTIEFKDSEDRINLTRLNRNNDYYEVKLYWLDETKDPPELTTEKPKRVSPKTANTHISNFVTYFLPKYDKFLIRPEGEIRFRLFRIVLEDIIDKDIWDLKYFDKGILLERK